MRTNRFVIEQWVKSGRRDALVIVFNAGYKVGGSLKKGSSDYIKVSKLRVVLKPEKYNGMDYYILTSYPIR
ncbi:RNase A-like domain-containing protein [Oligella sp. HMSC09E12]|nr:hypothetical protein HMPREF3179_06675 [Oligella sp. HMSC09E12]